MLGAHGLWRGIFIMPHLLWLGASVLQVSYKGLPHSVASFDTQGDVEDLLESNSSWVFIQSHLTTSKEMLRTYPYPYPNGCDSKNEGKKHSSINRTNTVYMDKKILLKFHRLTSVKAPSKRRLILMRVKFKLTRTPYPAPDFDLNWFDIGLIFNIS
jgi:hypothetical protein